MKVIVQNKVNTTLQSQKEEKKRRGKTSRNKGSNFERLVAKKFEEAYGVKLVRTPLSGGLAKSSNKQDFKGDIVCAEEDVDILLGIECKNQKTWSLPAWLKQSEEETPDGKVPCVVFHKHGTSKDYITLSLDDFLELVPKDSIIVSKV